VKILIQHTIVINPVSTHKEKRKIVSVADKSIHFLERNVEDIISDLDQALSKIQL